MLGELLRQLGAGRALGFLLAGLLPAFLLIVGIEWYDGGESAIEKAVGELRDPKRFSVSTLKLLAVALAFYGARGYLLAFLQGLPSPPVPSRLRDALLRRQIARARREGRRVALLGAQNAVFDWIGLRDTDYAPGESEATFDEKDSFWEMLPPPRWLYESARPLSLRAQRTSHEAREFLRSLASRVDGLAEPSREAFGCVCKALLELRVLAADPSQHRAAREEIARWRDFLRQVPEALPMLVRIRRAVLRQLNDAFLRLQRYPAEQWLQPTALGNRLAALDDYASRRYGIPTSTLLLRIWGVASTEERSDVANAQLAVEALVTVAFALLALAGSIAFVWWRRESLRPYEVDWRTLAAVLSTAALSAAAYRAAVTAFGAVEERIMRLVDLKRLKMLASFGYAAPETVAQEQEQLAELYRFFTLGSQRSPERKLEVGS